MVKEILGNLIMIGHLIGDRLNFAIVKTENLCMWITEQYGGVGGNDELRLTTAAQVVQYLDEGQLS